MTIDREDSTMPCEVIVQDPAELAANFLDKAEKDQYGVWFLDGIDTEEVGNHLIDSERLEYIYAFLESLCGSNFVKLEQVRLDKTPIILGLGKSDSELEEGIGVRGIELPNLRISPTPAAFAEIPEKHRRSAM